VLIWRELAPEEVVFGSCNRFLRGEGLDSGVAR
jgi:hypothetical protein